MVEIRRVRPEEWRQLRELRLEALLDSPDAFWTRHEEALREDDDRWRQWTAMPCHVACEGGRLVGMVSAFVDADDPGTADLIAMFVSRAARGRGIGASLVARQLEWAREEGFTRMILMVNVENTDARRLYERAGFSDTGRRLPLREGPHVLAELAVELESD